MVEENASKEVNILYVCYVPFRFSHSHFAVVILYRNVLILLFIIAFLDFSFAFITGANMVRYIKQQPIIQRRKECCLASFISS